MPIPLMVFLGTISKTPLTLKLFATQFSFTKDYRVSEKKTIFWFQMLIKFCLVDYETMRQDSKSDPCNQNKNEILTSSSDVVCPWKTISSNVKQYSATSFFGSPSSISKSFKSRMEFLRSITSITVISLQPSLALEEIEAFLYVSLRLDFYMIWIINEIRITTKYWMIEVYP